MKNNKIILLLTLASLFLSSCSCRKTPPSESSETPTTSETTSDPSSEPVSESTSEPVSETTSEPPSETTSEPVSEEINTYRVRWYTWDGNLLKTDYDVPEGTTPVYTDTPPIRAEDATHTYEFSGWLPEPGPIYSNVDYYASYIAHEKTPVEESRDYVFADVEGGVKLVGYYGSEKTIFLPGYIHDKPVVSIGNWAFYGNKTIEHVNIPDTVIDIGKNSFAYASRLKVVIFGSNLETIGESAFQGTPIESVDLPSSVRHIGPSAFAICYDIVNIKLNSTLSTIYRSSFGNIGDELYNIHEGGYYLGNEEEPYLVLMKINSTITTLNVHNDTKIIASKACEERNIETLNLGNSVHTICERAFNRCNKITSLTCPDSLRLIDAYAFYSNSLLETVNLNSGLVTIKEYALSYCEINSVVLPTSLQKLGKNAFIGNPFTYTVTDNGKYLPSSSNEHFALVSTKYLSTTTLDIVEGTELIADAAFSGCEQLTSLTIPSTVKYIGEELLNGCSALNNISVSSENPTFRSTANSVIIEKSTNILLYGRSAASIPYGTTKIGPKAFFGMKFPSGLTIPNTVTEIGESAFGNTDLASIDIHNKITRVGEGAFEHCFNLTNVTISNKLKVLSPRMFAGCEKLATITIPENITVIGDRAFGDCALLSNVSLSTNLVLIDENAFTFCTSLANVEFPASLRIIRSDAFANSGLDSFYIGEMVEEIQIGAFNYTRSLNAIGVHPENRTYDSRNDCNALINEKRNVLEVGSRSTIIPTDVVTIEGYAFSGKNISTINIPSNIRSIGQYAFSESALTEISIPYTVISLSLYAFSNCSKLVRATVSANVSEIPIAFFRNCNKLEEVSFPSSIRYIRQNAFYGCSSLVSIGSLSSISELGAYAFNGCSSLEQIILPTTCSKMYINCFKGCSSLHIYSEASEWPSTWFSNATFNPDNRPIYWYSETPNYDGSHWRYVSGVPTIWA